MKEVKEKLIFEDDVEEEIKELENEYKDLVKEKKEFGVTIYDEENWDRKIIIIKRLKILKNI